MNIGRLFNLKGLNLWCLASVIALNIIWTLGMASIVLMMFLRQAQSGAVITQMLLIAAAFIGPFLIAWLISAMAKDLRGPNYGWYGGLTTGLMLLLFAFPTGTLVIMLFVAAVAGGLNGGLMSLRRR